MPGSTKNKQQDGRCIFALSYSMMVKLKAALTAVVATALLGTAAVPVQAQTYLETYGQNRIQYRKFDWKFFDTKHFRVYHYDAAGRQLARFISEQAEQDISVVEKRLGGQFPHRFNIILYNNYDEFRQTNVGRKYDGQLLNVPAGTVDLVGDRLVVYFTGQHADLRRQLRSGMSRVVMQRMIFGENLREMVKNAVLLNLPQWTTDGFISYLVDGWDARSDNEWKNLLSADPDKGFYDLGEEHPEIAGKAFWKYVSMKYGENFMKNLLYTMQDKSSLNQAIKRSMGMNVKKAYDSCMAYYRNVYIADEAGRVKPDSSQALIGIKIPSGNGVIKNIRVSPRGRDVAYVEWKQGEYRVYLRRTDEQQTKFLILQGGQKDFNEVNPDPDYPMMAWSNNGYKLAILYKENNRTRIRIYNSLKARIQNYTIPANRFDRALGISFAENDDKLIFSAIRRSQSDLYEFTIRGSRMKNITNDAWDDLQPWFVSGGSKRGILFLSNRPKASTDVPIGVNELPVGTMNVFFYDTKTQSTTLLRCSDFTSGNVTQPIQYGSDNFAFLYDGNGIQNKYVTTFGRTVHNMDSAYSVPVSNYTSSILSHQYNPSSNQVADVIQDGEYLKVYFKPLELPGVNIQPAVLQPTTLTAGDNRTNMQSGFQNIRKLTTQPDPEEESLMKSGNAFQTEFADSGDAPRSRRKREQQKVRQEQEALAATAAKDTGVAGPDSTYIKMKAQRYRTSFKPDFFTVRLDNSLLFTRYQSYATNGGSFSNPSLGGLFTVSLDDVMENHRFTGGFRLPVNLSGLAYFLQYENTTRRVDWNMLFLRTETNYNYGFNFIDPRTGYQYETPGKVSTSILQGGASYPLDRIRSIRMNLGLRQDALDFKAQDTIGLSFLPREKEWYEMSRVEYVFDNSFSPMLNIREGYRYKVFGEYMYQLNNNGGGLYAFGTDFRYYQKIYRNFIFATRIAAAHSAGKKKILYSLGGVDNWLNPKDGQPAGSSSSNTYAFQALATNLRGYEQNARNGNTYAVFNGELRLPVLTTFIHRPIKSNVLRYLQACAFVDMGSAWNGLIPNDDASSNSYFLGPSQQAPNVSMNLYVPSNTGFAMGYGAGLRTMLLSYFMRLDAAWNIDGRTKPIWYFSIGTDF